MEPKGKTAPMLTLLILFMLAGLPGLWGQELISPDYVRPGERLTLFIYGDSALYAGGEADLRDQGGNVVSRSRFFLLPMEGDDPVWCALLGVSSHQEPGRYNLSCTMEGEDGTDRFEKRIGLSDRDYPVQTLKLNTELTDIRTKPDPLKASQAQEIWSIYSSFEPDRVYTTGSFAPPLVERRTTTAFGTEREYVYANGATAGTIHNGEDWAGPTGTPVSSVGDGLVVMAEDRIITGQTLVIELLPGVFMVYYHLDELLVKEGERVGQGQIVGKVGMTGLATGPHLHWELRISKIAVDPLIFLTAPLIDKTLLMAKIEGTL